MRGPLEKIFYLNSDYTRAFKINNVTLSMTIKGINSNSRKEKEKKRPKRAWKNKFTYS